jgi:hypothetical protein
MFSGVLAALWLLGLYYAGPALRGSIGYRFVDRLRDAIVLGVGIPLVLAGLHLLYPIFAWFALAFFVGLAFFRGRSFDDLGAATLARLEPPLVTIAAIALIAWPPLIRPILEGDSASYHLPIAAAWVHAHSLWVVDARYWWYPPGSESFAAGILLVAGAFAVNWSGLAAILLLAFRMYEWTREGLGAPRWLADAIVAATVTVYPIGMQAGTLQNDVWLAAFFIESLRCMATADVFASMRSAIVLSLIKPFGLLFALFSGVVSRLRPIIWIGVLIPIGLWAAHDAALWNSSIIPTWGPSATDKWSNSIAGNGLPTILLFASVILTVSPFAALAIAAAAVGPLIIRRNHLAVGLAGTGTVSLLMFTPLVTNDWYQLLSSGQSLRFAVPAIALGAIILTPLAIRFRRVAIVLLWISSLFGALEVFQVFWNDIPTLSAIAVSLIAVAIASIRSAQIRWVAPTAFGAAVIASVLIVARFPATYYSDGWRVHGNSTRFYEWVGRARPVALGGWGLRLGAVNELSPSTRTVDLPDVGACEMARRLGLELVAMAENDRTTTFNASRLSSARSCGTIIYDDGIAVVVVPSS